MSRWDQKGIPHKGWECIDMIDLGEDIDEYGSYDSEICEMCGQEGIRYVHVMTHRDYIGEMRVGRVCAEKMADDYDNPHEREQRLRNRHNRRINFLKQIWHLNSNGNYVLKYKGMHITIMPSKYNSNQYGVFYDRQHVWKYKGEYICDFRTAQLVAFDLIDI